MTEHPSNAEKFEAFTDDALDTVIDWLRGHKDRSDYHEAVLHQYEAARAERRHKRHG